LFLYILLAPYLEALWEVKKLPVATSFFLPRFLGLEGPKKGLGIGDLLYKRLNIFPPRGEPLEGGRDPAGENLGGPLMGV